MSLNLPQTMELRNINEGFFSCGINLRIIKFSCQRQFTKESPICCLKATISGSVVLTPVSFNYFLLTILTIDTYNPSAAHIKQICDVHVSCFTHSIFFRYYILNAPEMTY